MKLRPYQNEIIKEAYRGLKTDKKVLLVAPTGSGKTVITSHIINDAVDRKRKCWFIVHRNELVTQTRDTLKAVNPKLRIGIIKAGYPKPSIFDQIFIASAQTMTARNICPPEEDVVIIDEVHTVGFYKQPKMIIDTSRGFVMGVTATPWRTKKDEGLGDLFPCVVKAPSPEELVKMGFLAPAKTYGYPKTYNLDGVRTQNGDYKPDDLATACDTQDSNEYIVKNVKQRIENRTAIAFCVNVAHALHLSELFKDAGLPSKAIHGDTPMDERAEAYEMLRRGEIRILTSVGVLTEGFDIKNIGMVIMARPTKSKSLNVQMFGRGLRIAEGKKNCIVLDFAANYSRHGLASELTREEMDPDWKSLAKKGEPPSKDCPECGLVVRAAEAVCPQCGYIFPPKKPKPKEDLKDEMIEIQKKGTVYHRDAFTQHAEACKKKMWKLGKAKWDFKKQFGRWPTKWEMQDGVERYNRA